MPELRGLNIGLALLLAFLPPAWGMNPSFRLCNLVMASSIGEVPEELVHTTYKNLLLELGDGKISAGVIDAMVKAGDPYTVPPEAGLGSSTLQQSLHDLKEMLVRKTETPEPFKEGLLQVLKSLQEKQVAQEDKQQKNSARVAKPQIQDIAWPHNTTSTAFSPEGRWVVAVANGPMFREPKETEVFVFDRKTQNIETITVKDSHFDAAQFSPDGSRVYFGDTHGKIQIIPFKVGKLILRESRKSSSNEKQFRNNSMRHLWISSDEKWGVGAPYSFSDRLYLLNVDSGSSTPLKFFYPKTLETDSTPTQWQGLPHSNELLFTYRPKGQKTYLMARARIDKQGAHVVQTWPLDSELTSKKFATPDGNRVVFKETSGKFKLVNLSDPQKNNTVELKHSKNVQQPHVQDTIFDSESAWILVKDLDTEQSCIQAFDLETAQWKGTFELDLKDAISIQISPNKESLAVKTSESTRLFDYEFVKESLGL